MGEGYGRMTDTGKLPEGHQPGPDDAAGEHLPAPGTALPGAAAPAPAADDDDLLFLPGAQGAWTEQRNPAAGAAPPDAGARDAPSGGGTAPAGGAAAPGAEPAPGGQRRPLHMGPPVPEPAGGVVRSLADRGPASGSVDTREAVAAADAGAAAPADGTAPAATGNAAGTGADSPTPAAAAALAAPAGAEAPAEQQGAPEGPWAAPGDVPDRAAAAAPAAPGRPVHDAVPGAGAAGPHPPVPTAAGSVPPQAVGTAGPVPHPPPRTPGPPTTGPEYLDVTRAGATHLPGPQLGEIPPAPAGWTSVSHPADAEAVARAAPQEAGGAGPAAVSPPESPNPQAAPPALDGATGAAPADRPSGETAAQAPAPGGEPTPPPQAGAAGAAPVSAGVDAAQAAVRRAAASAGASLGRGLSTAGGTATASAGQDGSAAEQPADATAPQGGAAGGQPGVTSAVAATDGQQASADQLAGAAVPHAAAEGQPGDGAAGVPVDASATAAGPQVLQDGAADGQRGVSVSASGGPLAGGGELPGAGAPHAVEGQPGVGAAGVPVGLPVAGAAAQVTRGGAAGGRRAGAGGLVDVAAPPTAGEGQPDDGAAGGSMDASATGAAPQGGAAGGTPAGGGDVAGEDVPQAVRDGRSGDGPRGRTDRQDDTAAAQPADEGAAPAADRSAGTPAPHPVTDDRPGTGAAGEDAGGRHTDSGVVGAVAGEQVPGDRADAAVAQPTGESADDAPSRTGRQGDAAAPQSADGAVLHAVAGGQPVNGAKARAANGHAVPGGQPAVPSAKDVRQAPVPGVPAARAAGDEAVPAAAVHAAGGPRRGVSLGVQNGAQAVPAGSAAEDGADAAPAAPPADASAETAAPVAQLRGRRRRGTAVSAPVAAASATPAGEAQGQDAAAAAAVPVPAPGSPAPPPGPAAGAPGSDAAPAGTEGPGPDADAEAAPGFADAERAAVHRVMRERRDIRNGFRSDPVPHEVLLRVLEAAHTAPSVGHSQPWDFVVIRSEETRHRMHELARRQREAYAKSLPKGRAKQFKELKVEAIRDTPVNIVVTADPTRGGRHTLGRHTQPQMAPYSSALAVENLWLAARAEGLGVGWVSFFDERELVRELELPEHLDVVAYLCVGYVDEFPDEPELVQSGWSRRRPLSWVVHEESYGRRALPGEDPHDLLAETLAGIRPLDAKALGEAWERQKRMTKPAGALGMLEIISAQLCGLSRTCPPPVPEPAAVAVFAGDHGVHAQGVTPWPQEVTGQMVANFLAGGAVCNAFATQVGAEVCVVDAGVAAELPASAGLVPRKVRAGTADMTAGPAMSREEALRAVEVGVETARDLVAAGNKALLTGEMGIANTTASAALISVFTDTEPAEVTGRGTGIDDETHARKVEAVRRAIEVNRPDPADPVGVLAAVGGLEHAALVGFILAGSALRTPVLLDGVSAGAAALVARAVAPEALSACIAGHRSPEPGHAAALTKLGLRPLIDLDLRLGEGTGALLALPLVQSAARAMHEVATFDAAGVTEKG